MRIAKTLALASIFLCSVASAQELNTEAGTMQVGGSTAFRIVMSLPRTVSGIEIDGSTDVALSVFPTVGYFLIDDLELVGGVGLDKVFAEDSDTFISWVIGLRYFMAMGTLVLPYTGLDVGMIINIGGGATGTTRKALGLTAVGGVLIPLNETVGIDLGLRVNFSLGLDDQGNRLTIPMGYFGVQAFF